MKFLITAGPTREPIDPVRYISNRSSGKMGYALAEAASNAGHEVILISGPVSLAPPSTPGIQLVSVVSAQEMYEAVHAHLAGVDIAILAAAVSDFTPALVASQKIKKREGVPQIVLKRTPDILGSLGALGGMEPRPFLLVGFAAETENIERNAQEKLEKKKCDYIVANDVSQSGIGFDSDDNQIILFVKGESPTPLPRASKNDLAAILITLFCKRFKKR